jgi:hypothetical protein
MIKVIDNVIGKRYQEEIKTTLLSPSFDWHYSPVLTSADYGVGGGFSHSLCESITNSSSRWYDYFLPLVYEISNKSGVDYDYLMRARAFFQSPSSSKNEHDIFHVDDPNVPHVVFLYYVKDSDGDTVILKNKFQINKDAETSLDSSLEDKSNIEILERVTPKQGRVVVFDGAHYHAAGIPKKCERIVLNFDVFVNSINL